MFFFFNDTATTEIYTLSLHDALPICRRPVEEVEQKEDGAVLHELRQRRTLARRRPDVCVRYAVADPEHRRRTLLRSEEHTSELQSRQYLVCRLLLETKKKKTMQLSSS